jgi:hypothetical protein
MQAYSRPAAILVDELNAGCLQRAANGQIIRSR